MVSKGNFIKQTNRMNPPKKRIKKKTRVQDIHMIEDKGLRGHLYPFRIFEDRRADVSEHQERSGPKERRAGYVHVKHGKKTWGREGTTNLQVTGGGKDYQGSKAQVGIG